MALGSMILSTAATGCAVHSKFRSVAVLACTRCRPRKIVVDPGLRSAARRLVLVHTRSDFLKRSMTTSQQKSGSSVVSLEVRAEQAAGEATAIISKVTIAADSDSLVKSLYPEINPNRTGHLKVSELHSLYWEESGNSSGEPVVFLHGGPGAGTSGGNRRFFDPAHYRIILFDQRGSGKSRPHACTEENTTWDLVDDIEKIREHLGIQRWMVFGGSWGSTLALTYSVTHPEKVTSIILRGIFLLRKQEIDWFYQSGTSSIFPDAWEPYRDFIPEDERNDMLAAYSTRLNSSDPAVRLAAAKAWTNWEMATSHLIPSPEALKRGESDEFALVSLGNKPILMSGDCIWAWKPWLRQRFTKDELLRRMSVTSCNFNNHTGKQSRFRRSVAFARVENHYFMNRGFFSTESFILDNVDKIRHIPAVIVQGRYDVVCPMTTAWDLHRAWPEASLKVVGNAGHSATEVGISAELVSATERLKSIAL